jgi:hypothetical protein
MNRIDELMLLADQYAHIYSFVGDNTMPIARQALRTAIEQALKDERELCAQLCMPNFIGEYPPGSGRDDRYDLAKADCAAEIRRNMK